MRRRRTKGFTLIELMVTVAIIGLGLSIIFFKIDTFLPASRLQAACRELVADLEHLRLVCIMVYKQPIYLVYDKAQRGYWAYLPYEMDEDFEIIGPGQTELLDFRQLPDNIVFNDVHVGARSNVIMDTDQVTVLIHPDGSVTGHTVEIRDEYYEKSFFVRMASLTGFAEILDEEQSNEEIDDNSF
jgi:prepilin-type N-terminal cleavage/methylation domain-containing protein